MSTSPRDRRALVAAFLCGAFAFLDLYCTQPLLPLLASVFHATQGEVGATISASTLGVASSAALLAFYGERLSRKRTLLLALTLRALTMLLCATSPSLRALTAWRLLQGLLTPGVSVMALSYVTEEWPPALVPRAMSVYVAGTVFGGFCGRLTGGLLAVPFGWRAVFVVLGGVGLVGAGVVAWLLPSSLPRPLPPRERKRAIVRRLLDPRLLATFGVGFCMLFVLVAAFSYVTFYLAAPPFSLSPAALGWLFSVYLFGLLATLATGRRLTPARLRGMLVASSAVGIVGLALTLFASLPLVGLGLALVGSGVFIAHTCANSYLREASPTGGRVAATGTYACCYYLGGTLGGVLPAAAWRWAGWSGCVALIVGAVALAAMLAWLGWRAVPVLATDQPID